MNNYEIPADKESKLCNGTELSPESHMSITRPELQPIATAVPDIADDHGRYAKSSHRIFRPLYVIHVLLLFKPYLTGSSKGLEWSTGEAVMSVEGTVGRTSNIPTLVYKRLDEASSHWRFVTARPKLSVCIAWPVAASQSRTVSSSEADASVRSSGEKVTLLTWLLWPLSVCIARLVAASQSRTVLSAEADASVRQSGEKATL